MGAIKLRLFIAALIWLFTFSLRSAVAEDYIHLSTYYYDIKPNLTVTSPICSISKDLSMNTNVLLRFTVDNVKIDGVTGATKSTGASTTSSSDTRKVGAASVSHTIGDWKVEAGYVYSIEEDYRSSTPSISVSRDFFQRNTTLNVGYSHNFDEDLNTISGEKNVNNYSASLTQVLSPWTLMQVGYTFSDANGYLANSHRNVIFKNGGVVPEYVPGDRKRNAVGIRIAQWLPTNGSIHLSYRRYWDSWKIDSNTYQVQINQYLLKSVLVRGEYRYYSQDGADFFKDSYGGAERFLTSTVSSGPLTANLYGLKAIYTIDKINLNFEAGYEKYHQSTGLDGDIFMLGVRYMF